MKRALVTGSARGFGAAIAKRLIEDGYQVIGIDIAYAKADASALASQAPLIEMGVDIASTAEINALMSMVTEDGRGLHLLVNNAMWIRYDVLEDIREEDFDRMVAIGFKAPLLLTQASAQMLEQSGGSVVNISSIASLIGIPRSIVYGSIKGAMSSLTRHLAVDLAPRGVRVNSVGPGYSPTPGVVDVVGREGEAKRIAATPLGRVCEPEDVAAAVSYLASPGAAFVTGQLLVADGGISISL